MNAIRRVSRFFSRIQAIRDQYGVTDPDLLLSFFEPPSLGSIFKPLQMRSEVRELFLRIRSLRPSNVVEIGTNNGGTLFLLCRAAAEDATIVSVDLPGGRFGGGYSILKAPYYRKFGGPSQKVRLIRKDSHATGTRDAVIKALRGSPIDFLFLDGDHTHTGVKKDFEMYGRLVRPGGLIAFHDILAAPEEIGGGVPRFWKEIKSQYENEELIQDHSQGMMGIGVIRVSDASSQSFDN